MGLAGHGLDWPWALLAMGWVGHGLFFMGVSGLGWPTHELGWP
jgi:hypothetical protein